MNAFVKKLFKPEQDSVNTQGVTLLRISDEDNEWNKSALELSRKDRESRRIQSQRTNEQARP